MDYRQRFSAEAKGKGKKKVSFSFPSDGASTSQVSLEEENHSLLSSLPDRESYHADDAQFRALRKQNKKLVYKELIPELGRICLDLERSTDKVKRGLYPIPNSADFDVSHSFSHGVHLREILLAGGLDSSDEESDDDDDGKHDIPIGKVPASSKAETEETAGKAGKASEEEEERSLRDNAPSSTSKAKVSHTKSDKSDTREPSNLVDDSTPATPAKVTRRKEKVSEKVDEFRKEVALHTDAVKTYYNKLILERGNRSFFSVADAARVIEFPEVPPSKDVSSINSNLVIKSKKLQFIRALKSMRRAKLSNARKNLRSFEIRSRDVDKELMFNEKQMIIRKSASKNRSIQVPPAVGMQQKQWLPSYTHGDSKNIHAHYHQLIAGGRFNTRESHHSTLWEGSSFKVTLLQDLSTKLRLKVHFMAWKAAYESMLSMDLLITAATNKSNRALKRVVLKEYKKLLVHLRSRTKDAIASIEQFVRKRTLRIWQRQCRRAIFLRLMFQRLSAQHKSRLYKNVMLNWRKMSKREILLRKKFNHLSRTHEARIRRHYLTFWMKHARKEVLLARNFLWLSKVHENNIKRSMMIYWKVMILRERIDGVNVGLASVYLRKKLSHIVMYKWREAVSKANILRNALYSDWDKEGRGHKSTGGSSYKSINPQEGQTSQGMTKLLTEMKRARSALMPKIKLLQDIQPTLWESMVQKNLDCNSGDEEDEEGIDGENEFALKLSRPSYYDEASQPESESETSNPTSKPKIKENVELGNSRSLVEDKERIRVIPTESKHIIENEKMSVGTSPAQPPKLIDEANQGVEDVESQSQDIATITQAVVPVVVDKAVAVTQTVSAGTSPVQPPKMIDEANQAVDTVESQDMATITDESDRVVDIVDEGVATETVSAGTSPVQAPKMIDESNYAVENVESQSQGVATITEEVVSAVVVDEAVAASQTVSAGTSPVQPPKMIDEANQAVDTVESQDMATITDESDRVVVDEAATETVSAGTSPVQPPKMIDEANQAVDTVESQDMATITDESDRVVDIVDEAVAASQTVSAGTSPVQPPKMIDEANQAVDTVESQDMATITDESDRVVVDEAATETVSAGTSPVQPPKMIDEANQAVDTVESQDMATITEEVVSVVVDEAVTVRASAVTSPVQSEEPVHSTRSDLKFEEPQRVQSKSLRPIGATQTGSVVSIFLPSTEIVQYKSNRGASTSIPPIRSIKKLAEAFYHRNLCRKIMKAIKVQLARSKQVNYLAQESYRWHIFRYFLKKWYENTVILSRITVLRGNRVICSNHLKAWRKFTIASKAFNERFDCVRKSHEIHVMRAAFKLCRKAFSGSIMLRGRLAEFRKKMTKIQCQKALHIWRLWSNLHITRRVAVLRINFRVKLRVKRRCLINWWHFVQSNKLLRKVISQATESHGQTHSVERTLENTFSLLMRVLYSWKRLTSLRKGLGGNMSAASIVQRSLAHLTSKRLQGEREAASRETCHRMFLVWYLFVKNLRSSGDDHSGRLKLREKTKFRTESQYYRFKILSKYIKMLRKALMLKETVAKSHNTLRKYTTSWKAWRAFVSNFRNLQLVADRKYSERLLSSTLKSWRLIVMNRIGASKIMRSRLLSVVAAWKEMSSIESKVMKYWKNRTLYAALIRWKASRNSRSSTEANPSRPISNSPYFGLERGKRIVADDIHKWKDSGSNTVPDLQSKLGISTGKQTKVRRNLDAEFARRIPKRVPTSNSILAAQYVLKQNIVGELKEMRSQWKLEELLSKHNHFTQIA